MTDLKSHIDSAGMAIPDSLHAMLTLRALPSTYEVVQRTILVNVRNYKTLTSVDMRAQILSEELHQGTAINVHVIRTTKNAVSTDSCNWCGGMGHWEWDCRRRLHGLSLEEAQSERRKGNKFKGKGKQKADTKDLPSVNAVIKEASSEPSPSNLHVDSASNDSIVFYSGHETKWMLGSGRLDHITHRTSDFTEYQCLHTPKFVHLADSTTRISYLGTGTGTEDQRVKQNNIASQCPTLSRTRWMFHIHSQARQLRLHDHFIWKQGNT